MSTNHNEWGEVPTMNTRHAGERQHVADIIRIERLQRGWSVGEAAEKLGVYGSAWSRWETGTSLPRPAMMQRIGVLLDMPDDWMVAGTPSQPTSTVDIDDRLARIEERQQALLDQMLAEGRRVEQLYQRLLDGTTDDQRRHDDSGTTSRDAGGAGGDRDSGTHPRVAEDVEVQP